MRHIFILLFFLFFHSGFASVPYQTHKIVIDDSSFNAYVFTPAKLKEFKTLVFLPSFTYPLPLPDDFVNLIDELKDEFQIVVVEYFGYKGSEDTHRPRTSENICYEIHCVMKELHVSSYILVPHSISGLYSLSYINRYPAEVEAIIGIDMTLSCYFLEEFPSQEEFLKYPFRDKDNVTKAFANMYDYFWLTSKELENFSFPERMPVLCFLSSQLEEYMDKEIKEGVYKTSPLTYLRRICKGNNQRIIQMQGTHYLYRDVYKEIATAIRDFIKN